MAHRAFTRDAIELRCPHCKSRSVAFHRSIGMRDEYGCGKCWRNFTIDGARFRRKV